ncbi:MAG TPA: nicotinate-nucleotide adenylyltransferase [Caulobacteraceae bacterium]
MRVGLYGGTFNPAHAGHAHVANTAMARLDLDRLVWLVAAGNPLKARSRPLRDRARSAAALARRAMVVSRAEERLKVRYTIDTVRLLKARFPRVRFVWVMGADSLAALHRWRDWAGLMREVPVAVVARPGFSLRALTSVAARRFARARLPSSAGRRLAFAKPPAWIYLTGPWNYASSTALRMSCVRQDLDGGAW